MEQPHNQPKLRVSDLFHATPGSAALDIVAIENQFLQPTYGVYKIHTNIFGPIPKDNVGLIIGRSSLTSKGVFIQLGVINSDYEREIFVMMSTSIPFQKTIKQRISQLLLLPYVKGNNMLEKRKLEALIFGMVVDLSLIHI